MKTCFIGQYVDFFFYICMLLQLFSFNHLHGACNPSIPIIIAATVCIISAGLAVCALNILCFQQAYTNLPTTNMHMYTIRC